MSLPNEPRERPNGRKVHYAVVGAGWISQEDFMPAVEHTGNSVITALVTGDPAKAKALSKNNSITGGSIQRIGRRGSAGWKLGDCRLSKFEGQGRLMQRMR